jgi:hypothetical protein
MGYCKRCKKQFKKLKNGYCPACYKIIFAPKDDQAGGIRISFSVSKEARMNENIKFDDFLY